MIESNTSEVVKPLHLLAQSLLREFKDVSSNDLPLRLPPLRGIEHEITFYWVLLYPINRLIGVILMNQKSYNDKSKSYLITLGRV